MNIGFEWQSDSDVIVPRPDLDAHLQPFWQALRFVLGGASELKNNTALRRSFSGENMVMRLSFTERVHCVTLILWDVCLEMRPSARYLEEFLELADGCFNRRADFTGTGCRKWIQEIGKLCRVGRLDSSSSKVSLVSDIYSVRDDDFIVDG